MLWSRFDHRQHTLEERQSARVQSVNERSELFEGTYTVGDGSGRFIAMIRESSLETAATLRRDARTVRRPNKEKSKPRLDERIEGVGADVQSQ